MIETVKNAWKIPELRKKLTFVLFAIVIFRLGFAIYVPFVDTKSLALQFSTLNNGNLLGYFNTLSGGESFLASLALALGLSDVVQAQSGAIRMDAMFIDEGFGTLDDESLKNAINALASLSEGNRLVGIISHVGELKEKIDKQIVVTKARAGGSSARISLG